MRRGIRKGAAWLAAGAAAIALLAAPAPAAIYWGDSGTIGAANLDGSDPNSRYLLFRHLSGPTCDIAVSDSHLYWCEWFGLWRVNLDGPAAPTQVVSGLSNPGGIAIDGNHLYWANRDGDSVARSGLDGSGRNDSFITGLDSPCEVVVDGEFVYWIDWRGIGRARLDGSGVEEPFIPTAPGGCGLAVDAGYLYWSAGEGAIGRATLDGAEVDHRFITGVGIVGSIATSGGHIYWTDKPEGMAYSSIDRATLGVAPVRDWIVPPIFTIGGVAADLRYEPPPRPLPSLPISFGLTRYDKRAGTAVVDVTVPRRGDLRVLAPKVGWKVIKGPEPPPSHIGSFRWRLKIWPGLSPKGNRIRTQLRNKGRAKVALRLSYTEEGQLPSTTVKRVTLRKVKKKL
ncbi:MAG TPA: hypothetical protein VN179_06055 [Solirubrobacterales bacterium]|nr:hypothetical protein [Solirubrobacterales bacterium]